MRISTFFATLFIIDKAKKFDEMHEAITRPKQPADTELQLALKCARENAAESREQERMLRRRAGARKHRRFCDGRPFRVFRRNALSTTCMWAQGRKLFAETYDDGRMKGYAVYEGEHLDLRVYSIEDFESRYGRWEDSTSASVAPPPRFQAATRRTPPVVQRQSPRIPPVITSSCPRCGTPAAIMHRYCSQCGQPIAR